MFPKASNYPRDSTAAFCPGNWFSMHSCTSTLLSPWLLCTSAKDDGVVCYHAHSTPVVQVRLTRVMMKSNAAIKCIYFPIAIWLKSSRLNNFQSSPNCDLHRPQHKSSENQQRSLSPTKPSNLNIIPSFYSCTFLAEKQD